MSKTENKRTGIPTQPTQILTSVVVFADYPGFCYSPEGEAKALSTPYRPRRKSGNSNVVITMS